MVSKKPKRRRFTRGKRIPPTNRRKLADELEVSSKTIMRDLAFMRDQLE